MSEGNQSPTASTESGDQTPAAGPAGSGEPARPAHAASLRSSARHTRGRGQTTAVTAAELQAAAAAVPAMPAPTPPPPPQAESAAAAMTDAPADGGAAVTAEESGDALQAAEGQGAAAAPAEAAEAVTPLPEQEPGVLPADEEFLTPPQAAPDAAAAASADAADAAADALETLLQDASVDQGSDQFPPPLTAGGDGMAGDAAGGGAAAASGEQNPSGPDDVSPPMPLESMHSHLSATAKPARRRWYHTSAAGQSRRPALKKRSPSLLSRLGRALAALQIHPNTLKHVARPYLCPFLLTLCVYLLAVVNSSIYHGRFTLRLTESAVLFAVTCGFGCIWIWRSMVDHHLHARAMGLLTLVGIIATLLIPAIGIAYVYHSYLELAPFGPSLRTSIFGISVFLGLFFCRALVNLLFPNRLLDAILRHLIAAVVCCLLALQLAILVHPLIHGVPLGADTIRMFMQTDLAEAIEFAFEYWVIIVPLVVLALVHCTIATAMQMYRDRGRYDYVATFFIDFVLLLMAAGAGVYSSHNYLYEVRLSVENMLAEEPLASRHVQLPQKQLDSYTRPLKGVYLLVIGESLHRGHMSGYGYQRKTTPFLDLMLAEMPYNIVRFERPYACDYRTVNTLKRALTAINLYNDRDFDSSPSLIEAARANGFDTYWISNQNRYAWADTEVSFITGQATMSVFTSDDLRTIRTPYDESVLPYLDELRNMQNGLIVVHLYGSHFRFAGRYPKRFEIYKGHTRTDYYDNSVVYNDYIIKRIYEMFKENSNFNALLYFSDHGAGAEDELKYSLHHPAAVEIPMYAILSEKFMKQIAPSKFNALRDNARSPITNDLVYNTMLSLMNITIAGYEDYNDPLSERYDGSADRFRTYGGRETIAH